MEYAFHKLQSLGNDFVLLDLRAQRPAPAGAALKRLADRRLGVGCDQVLSLHEPAAAGADVDCHIHNADGSMAEQCGNGMRCVALYLLEHGDQRDARRVTVGTPAGQVALTPLGEGRFRADMGVPVLDPASAHGQWMDNEQALAFTAIALGNPHAVFRVADVRQVALERIGRAMQAHPMFPRGVNVGVLGPEDGPGHARLRVYERGAGETRACGSGACAAAVAGRYNGWLSGNVELAMPGGVLQVEWDGPGTPVWLTGPAQYVYAGNIDL